MGYSWWAYQRRWGYFSSARGRKPKKGIAGRRLKYPCEICGEPIKKGERYVILYYVPDIGCPSVPEYYHEKCLEERKKKEK